MDNQLNSRGTVSFTGRQKSRLYDLNIQQQRLGGRELLTFRRRLPEALRSFFMAPKAGASQLSSPLDSKHVEEIRRADRYYSEKVFEYPAKSKAVEGYPGLPDLVVLRSVAELLVTRIEALCLDA